MAPHPVSESSNCSNFEAPHWSRDYYRRNKRERNIVHKCPHCDYETTGPKQSLRVHIMSRHTPEKDRPFQCPEPNCCRGFAQKFNLQKHLLKVHGKETNLTIDKSICLYIIKPGNYCPCSNKTKCRCKFYKTKPVIKASDLPVSYENIIITDKHLRYDARQKYISLDTYTKSQLKELQDLLQSS